MRWRDGSWQLVPSPGPGSGPALDFTPSGKPVVAYLESPDDGQTLNFRVNYWTGNAWRSAGDTVATLSCGAACYPATSLDLSVDPQGRPVVAWGESTGTTSLSVGRCSGVLP
jgi:hypothetical protein